MLFIQLIGSNRAAKKLFCSGAPEGAALQGASVVCEVYQ